MLRCIVGIIGEISAAEKPLTDSDETADKYTNAATASSDADASNAISATDSNQPAPRRELSVERQLADLQRFAARAKRDTRRTYLLFALWAASCLAILVLFHSQRTEHSTAEIVALIAAVGSMLLFFGHTFYVAASQYESFGRKRGKQTPEEYAGQALEKQLREIAKQAGSKAIGPLIDVMRSSPIGIGFQTIYPPLISLLTQVRDEDANCINHSQREFLCKSLKPPQDTRYTSGWNDDFRVAILKALEHIGDSQAIPIVEALANSDPDTSGERRVRDAARECQLRLWQHSGQVDAAETLLRASSRTAEKDRTLLRPASGKLETAPHELLRPTESKPPPPPISL